MQGLVTYSSSSGEAASQQEDADRSSTSSTGGSGSDSEKEHGHERKRQRRSGASQRTSAPTSIAVPAPDLSSWQAPNLQAGDAKLCSDAVAAKLYQGRQLAFPIVHGQYASLVMIPVILDEAQCSALHELITSLQQLMPGVTSLLPPVLPASTAVLPTHAPAASKAPAAEQPAAGSSAPDKQLQLEAALPHISLSRTVPLPYSKVEMVVGGLRDALAGTESFRMQMCVRAGRPTQGTRPSHDTHTGAISVQQQADGQHDAQLQQQRAAGPHTTGNSNARHGAQPAARMEGVCALVNEEGTRSFVCVELTQGLSQVTSLIRRVDRVFSLNGLQTFYQDPRPHLSIAWMLGDQRSKLEAALSQLASQYHTSQPARAQSVVHASWQDGSDFPPQSAAGSCEGQNAGMAWGGGGGGVTAGDGTASGHQGQVFFQAELQLHHIVCRVGIKEHVVWKQAVSAGQGLDVSGIT